MWFLLLLLVPDNDTCSKSLRHCTTHWTETKFQYLKATDNMKCKGTCRCCTLSSLECAIAIFWHSFLSPVAGFSWGNKCWALRNIYLCSGETTRVFISQWNRQQNKGGQATELMPANLCWIQTTRQRKSSVANSSDGLIFGKRRAKDGRFF